MEQPATGNHIKDSNTPILGVYLRSCDNFMKYQTKLLNYAIASLLISTFVQVGIVNVSVAQTKNPVKSWLQAEAKTDPKLTQAIESYLKKQGDDPKKAKYKIAEIDLNGDKKKDALVLLEGMMWCGTGGCTMLVFQQAKDGFRMVSSIPLVREPVIVSETSTKGWRDIQVYVSKVGNVLLKFNGSSYPANPSLETPLPATTKTRGVEVFPEPK